MSMTELREWKRATSAVEVDKRSVPEVAKPKELRDEFAVAALAGVVANDDLLARILRDKPISKPVYAAVAERIYQMADAMLEARKQ